MTAPEALLFDVFGTCVDWRGSMAREGEALGQRLGIADVDWVAVAEAWRGQYQPQMETVRSRQRPWVTLDTLHREGLDAVLAQFGLDDIPAVERETFTNGWRCLDPWPDVGPGLRRLRGRYLLAPNSNGNIALMVRLARWANLPWDTILGAEIAHAYKPQPAVYLRSVEALGLAPAQVMMVAAHSNDLDAAAACGLQTAFVPRPLEFGPGHSSPRVPERTFDLAAVDFEDLARQLGC
ncbi:MAG: haloacid dehalogenase type II [Thermomicrobiales bacterium]|nr:haloacid dehalogenase type II [Thermomicrobiales bacterium]